MEPQPKDTTDMVNKLEYMTLDVAEGNIEAGPEQQERLDEFTERLLTGEFHVTATGEIPYVCIDGRPGDDRLGPNAAGGSNTITVADDWTGRRFSEGKTTAEAHAEVVGILAAEGKPVGGHCADHVSGSGCGCGAQDREEDIYSFASRHDDFLRTATELADVPVSDTTHEMIMRSVSSQTRFSTGVELSAALKQTGGADVESTVRGAHFEVLAIVNLRKGTTLDRKAVAAEFGSNYQAFNVDAWSFAEAANCISLSEEEIEQKVVAMVYYNLATAGVLCGKKMRVGILR